MRAISELILTFITGMLPPADGSDPSKVRWWRMKLCGVTVLTAIVLVCHISVSMGYAEGVGIPGTATTDDLKALAPRTELTLLVNTVADIQQTQKRQIDDAFRWHMRELRLKYCASKDGLREEYDAQLRDGLLAYARSHNGQQYPMNVPPDCPT